MSITPPVHPSLTYREWQNARASAAVDDPVVDAVADAGAGPEAVAVADGPPIYPDEGPRRSKRFAVVVLQVADSKWRPRDGNAVMPGGHLAAMDTRLQAEFVLAHNANEVQRRRGAFAVLTIKGGVVVLYAVSQKQRPSDPGGLPVHAINGFTRDEAVAEARRMNAVTLQTAFIPRQWAVACRSASEELLQSSAVPCEV